MAAIDVHGKAIAGNARSYKRASDHGQPLTLQERPLAAIDIHGKAIAGSARSYKRASNHGPPLIL